MGAGNGRGWRRLAAGVFLIYAAVVAYGVFGPDPGDHLDKAGDGARKVAGEINEAIPGGRTTEQARADNDDRLIGQLRDEDVGNVAMFVPLGLMFPLMFPRWRWWTVLVGVAASAAIELVQLVLLSWRSPTLSDIAFNSLGTVIGFVLWVVACVAVRASQQRLNSSGTMTR